VFFNVKFINSIKQSTFSPFEIIVVDSKSTDNTKSVAESIFPDIKYIYSPKAGPAEQRNYGSSVATGEIFCFIDADTVISKSFLEKVNKFF
jgi:glycosyltransferase involved in cell wall biosynthesis